MMIEVAVLPMHQLLDDLVQIAQGGGGRNLRDAVAPRLDIQQNDFVSGR
jgi:hypothetical protein